MMVQVSHQYQVMREWGYVCQFILSPTEESSSRTRWMINVEDTEA